MKPINFRLTCTAVLLFGFQFFSLLSIAQGYGPSGPPPQTIYKIDWSERLAPSLGLKAHDHTLLGDAIDQQTGRLSFEHVDVSIPGNSQLPVEVRRRRNPSQSYKNEFEDWQLAAPTISTKIMESEFSSGIRWGKNRCTAPLVSSVPVSNYMKKIDSQNGQLIYQYQYSDGVVLDVPGRVSAQVRDKSTTASWPATAVKTTAYGWYLTCIPNIDGAGTEGFYAFAPNGDKYTFNVIRVRKFASKSDVWLVKYDSLGGIGHYNQAWAYYDVLAASEVTDVNGNWVRYTYDSEGKLTRIYSNDGREIGIQYSPGGTTPQQIGNQIVQVQNPVRIISVKSNPGTSSQREWTYSYTGASYLNQFVPHSTPGEVATYTSVFPAVTVLRTVTLPDGRQWNFKLDGLLVDAVPGTAYAAIPYSKYQNKVTVTCKQANQQVSLTHPDGVTGTFDIEEKTRLLSFVNLSQNGPPCPNTNFGQGVNTNADVMAVVKKTLSSPTTPSAVWEYSYVNPGQNGATSNITSIKQPDGSIKSSYFTPPFEYPKLFKEEFFSNTSTTPIQTIDYTYVIESGGGSTFISNVNDAHVRPLLTTITQGSDWYKTQHAYITDRNAANYSYGYPVTTDEWSSLGNGTRTTNVTYLKDADDWILGLPDTVIKSGKLFDDYDWDDKGRLITHKQFGVTVATLGYHTSGTQSGQLYSYYDALNRLTTFNDYYRGTPRLITRADNSQISYQIDENGWVKGITNARGYTTNYQYNPIGRLTLIDLPSTWNDTSVGYAYSGGNLLQTVTKGMERTTNTFDAMLRPTKVVREDLSGSLGSIQSIKNYDTMGREIFASLPGIGAPSVYGKVTAYDAFSRVTSMQETAPGGGTTNYTYLAGNKVRVTDPMGNSVTTTSSGYGNPGDGKTLKVEKPAGITTDFTYNIYGNLLTISQAKGDGTNHLSSYIYDARLRVCRVKIPEKGDSLFEYNNANEKIAYVEGQSSGSICSVPSGSSRIAQTYDALSRPLLTDFADTTPDIARSYDANGNLLSVNRAGVNWSYSYNSMDLPESETLSLDGRSYYLHHRYDATGTRYEHRVHDQIFNFNNDNFGRVTSVWFTGKNPLRNITYHANGKINTLGRGNGGTYEQRLNERQLTSFIGGNWGDSQYYYYNANAQVIQIDAVNYNVYDRSFGYDGAGRLTSATGPWGSASYSYDSLNNIKQKIEGSRVVDIQYNSINQLANVRDNAVSSNWRSYSHDARGNVINDGKFSFNYDLSNQPIGMTGSVNSNFTYDGNLRRIKQIVSGETIYSIYDKSGVLVMTDNVTRAEKNYYVSLSGQTFAKINQNRVAYYPLNDHLGTAFMEADQNGSVAANKTYNYTPFGENSNSLPFGSVGNDPGNNTEQGFTGHIEDKSGLVYMQARYYDPVVGRFLSTDPIGYEDGLNVYAYVRNDPVNHNDPTGKFLNFVIGAGIGIIADIVVQTVVEGKSFSQIDGGQLLKSAAVGAVSGGAGGAAAKLAGSIGRAVASPASAMHQGASKVATGAATGAIGGAAGGAAGEATKQVIENGGVDNPQQMVKAAMVGAVTGGIAGAGGGSIQANAAQKTLGDSRAQTVFTSTQPGEKAATVFGAAADTVTNAVDAVVNACKPNQGGC